MNVLNHAYLPAGFHFNLVENLTILEPSWRNVSSEGDTEYDMKSKLRRGNYTDLNLYITSIAAGEGDQQILGYASVHPQTRRMPPLLTLSRTFPERPSKRAFELDGVVIHPGTLPGGSLDKVNGGITLVHEVGHWLSLFHTFEAHGNDTNLGGCYGQGDYIFDTPAEASSASGCPVVRNQINGTPRESGPES